ncbi:hypothetical protein AGMMS49940_17870 [Spirochaetia bacterium]|nr:hypothetical protein AGMMS49940_17870 [Spirochaetia bacterium]
MMSNRAPRLQPCVIAGVVLAALVVSGAVFYGAGGKHLVIADANSGRVYGRWPVKTGTEFSLEFIHSVNQTPVRDTFRVEGDTIVPTATRFSSFGAGMQSDLDEGQTLTRDGDAMVITGFTQSFKKLNLIVGTVSDHLLIIGKEQVSLRERCGQNAHISIRVR